MKKPWSITETKRFEESIFNKIFEKKIEIIEKHTPKNTKCTYMGKNVTTL